MIVDVIKRLVNTEMAAALCLSKGGWEGWLQCELWRELNLNMQISAEREVAYPGSQKQCDLVIDGQQWVELKAFGIFREEQVGRFIRDVETDVQKLSGRPQGTGGLAIVVVPKAISAVFERNMSNAGIQHVERHEQLNAIVYEITV